MKRAIVSMFFLITLGGVLFAQVELQPIVNVKHSRTEPITLKQIKVRIEALQKEAGRVMTLDERKKVIDLLINEKLVVQAAEKDGIKVADSEVNQNFTSMLSQQLGKEVTEAEFAQIVKQQSGMSLDDFMKAQNGMSLSEYKAFLKNQLIAQRYVLLKKQNELSALAGPSDKEIRSYYELNKQNFVQPDMIKLFLVVSPKSDSSEKSRKIVTDIQKQLKEKPSSASEVKIKSQVANSGYQAGDLYVNKNSSAAQQLGIGMEALMQIFEMKKNDVSEVTETDIDFQCFLIQEKYDAKILGLSDVVKPDTTITVYEYIKNNMLLQAQNIAVANALTEVIQELKKPDSVQYLKTGADLDKLLTW